ncbi:hypothetical protein GCM10029964_022150 [Kibdelosporangium lantanae]
MEVRDPDPDDTPPERPEVDLIPLDLPKTRSFMRMFSRNRASAGAATTSVRTEEKGGR